MRVRLTEKGRSLSDKIAQFEETHSKSLRDDPTAMGEIESATETLRRVERTWSDYLSYQEL